MLEALFTEHATPAVDVHAFTQDFIQTFVGDARMIDTTSCYKSSIIVEDEITREDGIADCMAPKLSTVLQDAMIESDVKFDRTISRIATGIYYLGGNFPEIAMEYNDCDEMQDDIKKMMEIYDKHFKNAFASLTTFAAILSVVEGYQQEILPLTSEYGSGKNAALATKIVAEHFPKFDPLML